MPCTNASPTVKPVLLTNPERRAGDGSRCSGRPVAVQDDHKVVALTLAPNEEQLLAAMDDGSLWGLDLTRLNNLPVSFGRCSHIPPQTSAAAAAFTAAQLEPSPGHGIGI